MGNLGGVSYRGAFRSPKGILTTEPRASKGEKLEEGHNLRFSLTDAGTLRGLLLCKDVSCHQASGSG